MVLAAQGASASIASFHTGGLNASVTVDHLIERAAAATSHNPVVNQQGLIGLGHFIESRYGVKLGDILFYNGKQTTSASLASPRGDIYGAAVVDPSSAQYGTIYLDTTAKGLSTRTLAATLGHETAHLDYAPGKGYLVFRDSSHTQEGLSDLAGKALTQALDVTHPGIWDTGHTAAWRQGLVDSPYTRIGTQYANAVGNARVKYRCGISADCYGGNFAKRFQQGKQQFIGYVGPYHIQARTDLTTGRPIGYLAYNTQTRRTITMKPQEVAGFYNLVSSGNTELVKRLIEDQPDYALAIGNYYNGLYDGGYWSMLGDSWKQAVSDNGFRTQTALGVATLGVGSILAPVARAGAMEAQVLAPEIRAAGVVQRETSSGNDILTGRMQGGGGVSKSVTVSKSRFPESAKHIEDAVSAGKPNTLTINRAGAKANRRDSLSGVKTKPGLDRDEFPPAMFQEGGKGASVRHINPSDNRGAGACIGAQCRGLPNGTRVRIGVVD